MRSSMNIIVIHENEIRADQTVVLSDHRAAHIRAVLKADVGQAIRMGVLNGPLGVGNVLRLDREQVVMQVDMKKDMPERPRMDLLLAMPRPKVMKRLWAQLAAIGVGRIYITNAAKVERNYFDTHILREDVIQERLIEGLQQAGDTIMPEVSIHKRLKVFIEDQLDVYCPDYQRIMAHPGSLVKIETVLSEGSKKKHVLLAIGPEGGWTEYERELFRQHGFHEFGFGDRILRTDTACVALLSLAHYLG